MNEPMQSGFVRRATEVHASSMDAVEQRVRSLTFDQAVNRARHASEERELMAQAVAPLYRIIAADEAAAAAMNNLAERRRADLSRLIGRKGLTPGGSTGGSARLASQSFSRPRHRGQSRFDPGSNTTMDSTLAPMLSQHNARAGSTSPS